MNPPLTKGFPFVIPFEIKNNLKMLFVDISQITVFCNKRNKNILTYFVISCQFFKTLKNSSFEE